MKPNTTRRLKRAGVFAALILCVGFVLPERIVIPVKQATVNSWNAHSFWYEPWGSSGVHKGIDIFAAKGTPVLSTSDGIVLFTGELVKGGRVVVVLSPRWRFHYFAHLNTVETRLFSFVAAGEQIGQVGDSGNAKGKPAHLHYSIVRLLPTPWSIDRSIQGYKKMFFIDPDRYLRDSLQ